MQLTSVQLIGCPAMDTRRHLVAPTMTANKEIGEGVRLLQNTRYFMINTTRIILENMSLYKLKLGAGVA